MLCFVHKEPVEPEPTKSPNRKKFKIKKPRSNDYSTFIDICNLDNSSKCNGVKRNGSPCRQDGTKSGGEIINGYCIYHRDLRK